MSDIFFEADAASPSHWRYWKGNVKERGGKFYAQVNGEERLVGGSPFVWPKTSHDAEMICAYQFGGKSIPA